MDNNTIDQATAGQEKKVVYTAKAHTIGGRDGGSSVSSDARLNVKLSLPGSPGDGTNPEQLFAAGWSSCLFSALKIEAGKRKIRFPADAAIDAEVDLCSTAGEYSLQVRFTISLPGLERTLARELAEAGHLICPYSKATHGNVKVDTRVV